MVLVFEILLVIFLFVCLVYGVKYLLLLFVKYDADKAFEQLCETLPMLYKAIGELIAGISRLSQEDAALAQNTNNLILQASAFSSEKDGNERIIAYANTIITNTKKLVDAVSEYDSENTAEKKYNKILSDFDKTKNYYNKSAVKLRHYADVFPTSFYARLKNIRTMDYLN